MVPATAFQAPQKSKHGTPFPPTVENPIVQGSLKPILWSRKYPSSLSRTTNRCVLKYKTKTASSEKSVLVVGVVVLFLKQSHAELLNLFDVAELSFMFTFISISCQIA